MLGSVGAVAVAAVRTVSDRTSQCVHSCAHEITASLQRQLMPQCGPTHRVTPSPIPPCCAALPYPLLPARSKRRRPVAEPQAAAVAALRQLLPLQQRRQADGAQPSWCVRGNALNNLHACNPSLVLDPLTLALRSRHPCRVIPHLVDNNSTNQHAVCDQECRRVGRQPPGRAGRGLHRGDQRLVGFPAE